MRAFDQFQSFFDVDDQSNQPLPKPIPPNRGDTVRVTCAYDASLRPKLRELQPLQPCYIVSGAGTSNEMCLAILNAKTKV